MRRFFEPTSGPLWLKSVLDSVRQALSDEWPTPIRVQSFVKADLPAASDWPWGVVGVTNEAGGAVLAFSDGTNWRRVTDRAIVS
jgi:hypothetical protein